LGKNNVNCQDGHYGHWTDREIYYQIKMGLDKATNNNGGQDLIEYKVNGAKLTFEYYWVYSE